VAIVLGGIVTYFQPWLPSEDDIRIRSNLKRQILLEDVNKRLQHLLCEMQGDDFELTDLRGAPPGQPDLIADFTAEFEQAVTAIKKLLKINAYIKVCFTFFLVTVAVPLVGFLAALVFLAVRPHVAILSYGAVAIQIILVFFIRWLTGRFEECEGAS